MVEERNFYRNHPEGAIIVALDGREEGFLFGAVELRGGEETWLNYERESDPRGETVSLYRETGDTPVLEYRAEGRRADLLTMPDRILIFWNRGRQALAVDGEPLPPGGISAGVPEGAACWLLRFAGWLKERG